MEYRAYLMRIKKERLNDYIEVHKKEKIWKSVLEGLIKAGYKKMIIYQINNELILFEEAEDLGDSYKYLEGNKESIKWEKMISEWMEEYPIFNEIKGDIEFKEIPVIFYFENGKLLH